MDPKPGINSVSSAEHNVILEDNRPTDFEYALLSKHIYEGSNLKEEDTLPEDPNWVINDIEDNSGYFGALYYNADTRQAVLVHRGTDSLKAIVEDFQGIFLNRSFTHQRIYIYNFIARVVKFCKKTKTHLSFTGHSLGAFLAELSVFYCYRSLNFSDVSAVTFESPGCRESLEQLQSHLNSGHIDLDKLDIKCFVSYPNIVNTCNHHIGTLYALEPNVGSLAWLSINQLIQIHTIGNIVTLLAKKDVAPGYVLDWPMGKQRDYFFEYAKFDRGVYSLPEGGDYQRQFELDFKGHYTLHPEFNNRNALPLIHFRPAMQEWLIEFYSGLKRYAKIYGITGEKIAEALFKFAKSQNIDEKIVTYLMSAALFKQQNGSQLFCSLAEVDQFDVFVFRKELSSWLKANQKQAGKLLAFSLQAFGKRGEVVAEAIAKGAIIEGTIGKAEANTMVFELPEGTSKEDVANIKDMVEHFLKKVAETGTDIIARGFAEGAIVKGNIQHVTSNAVSYRIVPRESSSTNEKLDTDSLNIHQDRSGNLNQQNGEPSLCCIKQNNIKDPNAELVNTIGGIGADGLGARPEDGIKIIYVSSTPLEEAITGMMAAIPENPRSNLPRAQSSNEKNVENEHPLPIIPKFLESTDRNTIIKATLAEPGSSVNINSPTSVIGTQTVYQFHSFPDSKNKITISSIYSKLLHRLEHQLAIYKKGEKDFAVKYLPLLAKATPVDEYADDLEAKVYAFLNKIEGKNEFPLFLLQGDSGAGKTTFSYHILQVLGELARSDVNEYIPILIEHPYVKTGKGMEDLIQNALQSGQYKLTQEEIVLLQRHGRVLFIIDSYDELRQAGADKNLKLSNIYIENELKDWGIKQAKLLITCRTHFLRDKNSYKQHFGINYEEWYIAPFNEVQINSYINQFTINFTSEKRDQLIPELKHFPGLWELIQNPLLLKMALYILPKNLYKQRNKKSFLERVQPLRRSDIFAAYVEEWFEEENIRLIHSAHDGSKQQDRQSFFQEYSCNFAWQMVTRGETTATYHLQNEKGYSNEQKEWEIFLSDNIDILAEKMACPLRRVGDGQYRFAHLGFRDYFAATYLLREIAGRKYTEGHALNEYYFAEKNPDVLQLCAELLNSCSENERSILFDIIEQSKTNNAHARAASNAITILSYAKVSFSRRDLAGIQIPYADLTEAVFYQTNLAGANLSHAILDRANLHGANLSSADVTDLLVNDHIYKITDNVVLKDIHTAQDKMLIVGCCQEPLQILDLVTGVTKIRFEKEHELDNIHSARLTPNGEWVILATSTLPKEMDKRFASDLEAKKLLHNSQSPLKAVNLISGQVVHLVGHTGMVIAMALSDNNQCLITGGSDAVLRIWQLTPPFESRVLATEVIIQSLLWADEWCFVLTVTNTLYGYHIEKNYRHVGAEAKAILIAEKIALFDVSNEGHIIAINQDQYIVYFAFSDNNWHLEKQLKSNEAESICDIKWIKAKEQFLFASKQNHWKIKNISDEKTISQGYSEIPIKKISFNRKEDALYFIGDDAKILRFVTNEYQSLENILEPAAIVGLAADKTTHTFAIKDEHGYISIISEVDGKLLAKIKGIEPSSSNYFFSFDDDNGIFYEYDENLILQQYGWIKDRFIILNNNETIIQTEALKKYKGILLKSTHSPYFLMISLSSDKIYLFDNYYNEIESLVIAENSSIFGLIGVMYSYPLSQVFSTLGAIVTSYGVIVKAFESSKVLEAIYSQLVIPAFLSGDVLSVSYKYLFPTINSKNLLSYLELILKLKIYESNSKNDKIVENSSINIAYKDYLLFKEAKKDLKKFLMLITPHHGYSPIASFFPFNTLAFIWEKAYQNQNMGKFPVTPVFSYSKENHILAFTTAGTLSKFSASLFSASFPVNLFYLDKVGKKVTDILDKHEAPVSAINLSKNGQWLCSADFDDKAILWQYDINLGKFTLSNLFTLKEESFIRAIGFSSNYKWLAIGSFELTYIISLKQKQIIAELAGLNGHITHLDFNDDNHIIITTDKGEISYWNLNEQALEQLKPILLWTSRSTLKIELLNLNGTIGLQNLTKAKVFTRHPVWEVISNVSSQLAITPSQEASSTIISYAEKCSHILLVAGATIHPFFILPGKLIFLLINYGSGKAVQYTSIALIASSIRFRSMEAFFVGIVGILIGIFDRPFLILGPISAIAALKTRNILHFITNVVLFLMSMVNGQVIFPHLLQEIEDGFFLHLRNKSSELANNLSNKFANDYDLVHSQLPQEKFPSSEAFFEIPTNIFANIVNIIHQKFTTGNHLISRDPAKSDKTWECTIANSDQLICLSQNKNKTRIVNKFSSSPWSELRGDQYEKCEINIYDELLVRHCIGKESEFIEFEQNSDIQPNLLSTCGSAAVSGALYAAIPEAIGDVLYLSGKVSENNAQRIKMATNAVMILTTGSWLATSASWLTNVVLKQVGVSESKARIAGTTAAFLVNTGRNLSPVGLASTAANYAGSWLGFWAEKQVAQRFSAAQPSFFESISLNSRPHNVFTSNR